MDKLVLVDAYSQIFRAFYGVKNLVNSKGEPTNALHGFIKILMKLENEFPSDYGAIVFDCGKVDFRMELNPLYKANRKETPAELIVQVPIIREFIEAFGWTIVEQTQYEADDLIGAIAQKFDGEVKFLSSDKDLSQIISDTIHQLVPDFKSSFDIRTPQKVVEKFGVKVELLVDYLTLLGDSADNIVGVAGIGAKTACKILNKYGSLQEILANPEIVDDLKLREKLVQNRDIIEKNQKLITLRLDLPLHLNNLAEVCRKKTPDRQRILDLCKKYELHSIAKDVEKRISIVKTEPCQLELF